jgi:hypothetical protein
VTSDRVAYVRQIAHAVKPGGHVIVSTFGSEGPTKCSGLDVIRYDAESLHREFGVHFRLLGSSNELHAPLGQSSSSSLLLQGRTGGSLIS